MGKIADALERHTKEKSTKVEFLHDINPAGSSSNEQEIAFAKEFRTIHECNPKLVVLSEPDSADAENFRLMRAQILFPRDRKRPRSIMVTSTFPGEGKTLVAANLAASLALCIDDYVLLIDCDLRRPQMHQIFGCPNAYGLHEYLLGEKQLGNLLIQSSIDKLAILPAGKAPRNPTELLSSAMMKAFLEEVKNRYQDRYIVIDSTPSRITAEAKVLAEYVDGIVFVVMAQRSPSKEIQKAIQNLGKEKILGIVFNGYNKTRRKYYKYHEKYYKGK